MKETLKVINQMKRDGVIGQYAIGGRIAADYYLEPASTIDVDVFVFLPADKSKLLSLSPVYEYLNSRGFQNEKEYVVVHEWPVQFLPPADALEEEAIREATNIKLEEVDCRLMTAEHLVAIALKVGRHKDINRIQEFISRQTVNMDTLKGVLSRHGLEEKWRTFERKHLAK
jgi:hypothetical protein